jgi:hypothetical protein
MQTLQHWATFNGDKEYTDEHDILKNLMSKIIVTYYCTDCDRYSIWELPFDILSVHEFYVKWDVLYVTHKDGEEELEYEADESEVDDADEEEAEHDFKYPNVINAEYINTPKRNYSADSVKSVINAMISHDLDISPDSVKAFIEDGPDLEKMIDQELLVLRLKDISVTIRGE